MSGGSLNYLYCKDIGQLFDSIDDVERAEAYLLERGYTDVALDVRRLIEYIRTAENRITVMQENLNGVFRAVEWRLSSDYGDDDLQKAIEWYRGIGNFHHVFGKVWLDVIAHLEKRKEV